MSRIVEASSAVLRAAIANDERVLAEFWATWCAQCGPMAHVVERLAESLPLDVRIMKIDVSQHEDAAAEHQILSLPALVYFAERTIKARITGFNRLPVVLEALRPHLIF